VAEFTESPIEVEVEEHRCGRKQVLTVSLNGPSPRKLYVDGAANKKGSRVGVVILSLDGITNEKPLRLGFSATNNEAEYETLLVEVAMVKKMGGKAVGIFSDLRLVVGQIRESWKPRI